MKNFERLGNSLKLTQAKRKRSAICRFYAVGLKIYVCLGMLTTAELALF